MSDRYLADDFDHFGVRKEPTAPSDALDTILKDYIAKHADGFFGKGTPQDAIRIREEAKAKLQALIDTTVVEARINELESLLHYVSGDPYFSHSPGWITDRIKELSQREGTK